MHSYNDVTCWEGRYNELVWQWIFPNKSMREEEESNRLHLMQRCCKYRIYGLAIVVSWGVQDDNARVQALDMLRQKAASEMDEFWATMASEETNLRESSGITSCKVTDRFGLTVDSSYSGRRTVIRHHYKSCPPCPSALRPTQMLQMVPASHGLHESQLSVSGMHTPTSDTPIQSASSASFTSRLRSLLFPSPDGKLRVEVERIDATVVSAQAELNGKMERYRQRFEQMKAVVSRLEQEESILIASMLAHWKNKQQKQAENTAEELEHKQDLLRSCKQQLEQEHFDAANEQHEDYVNELRRQKERIQHLLLRQQMAADKKSLLLPHANY